MLAKTPRKPIYAIDGTLTIVQSLRRIAKNDAALNRLSWWAELKHIAEHGRIPVGTVYNVFSYRVKEIRASTLMRIARGLNVRNLDI